MNSDLILVSSQFKHLPGRKEHNLPERRIQRGSALRNEPYSLQTLYRAECGNRPSHPVSISVSCDGVPMETYRVDPVPVTQAANLFLEGGYEGDTAGLYPDILSWRPAECPIETIENALEKSYFEAGVKNLLNALEEDYQSL